MLTMFYHDADGLVRVLVAAPLGYAALVLCLRIGGKRMLSKLSAFDLVVTIALGSTLATILLSKELALAEGFLALALLIGLQYAVAWSSARSGMVRRILKSEPALLFFQGKFLDEALRAENVPAEEVRAAIRSSGTGGLREVAAVVLEADGTLSVLTSSGIGESTTLCDVRNPTTGISADH